MDALKGAKRGRKPKGALDTTLSKGVDTLFHFVSFGYGEHWRLGQGEADTLGSSLAACAGTVSTSKMKAVEKLLDKFLPWAGLVGACATIVWPRVQLTRLLIAQEQARRNGTNVRDARRDAETSPTPNGASDGNPLAPSDAVTDASVGIAHDFTDGDATVVAGIFGQRE